MPLSKLTSSDVGAFARVKINAGFDGIDANTTTIGTLAGRVTATEGAITTLGTQKANQADFTSLSGTFSGFVENVVDALASNGTRIAAAEAAIGNLGLSVGTKLATATFESFSQDQSTYIQGLQERASALESSVNGLGLKTADTDRVLAAFAADQTTYITGLNNRAGALEGSVAGLATSKASQFNLTSLNRVFGRYRTSNDAAVAGLKARCDGVDLTVKEFGKQTASTGTRLTDLDARTAVSLADIRLKKADRKELTALSDLFDANRIAFVDQPTRPGDGSLAFTVGANPSHLVGPNAGLPLLPGRLIASGDNGAVARLRGAGVIGQRRARAVEYGRVYRPRFVLQRRSNPSDPAGDAVRCGVLWLDQSKRPLAGSNAFAVIADIVDLKTTRGRTERSALYGRSTGDGITLVAPPGARYARAFVQTYGADGVTDIEVIDIEDVTAAVLLPNASQDADQRLSALESLDVGAQLETIQAAIGTPNSLTLPSVTALQNTAVPSSATTVFLLGYALPGDGGAARYKRSPANTKAPETVTSAGGTKWEIMDRVIRPEMFGAVGDGIADDRPVIGRIINFLTAVGGGAVLYSAGRTYKQHGPTIVNGDDILITREAGARVYYPQTDHSYDHCFIIKGDRVTADGLNIYSDEELERNDTGFGICVETGFEITIRNCILEHIASASIWVQNATRTTVEGNTSLDSKADGIHFSNGAARFICTGNRIERANDDAIAMVMDTTDAARVSNGLVANNTVSEIYTGSGIVLCGVDATVITANTVTGTDNPAISCYNYAGVNGDRVTAGPSTNLTITTNTITAGGRRLEGSALTSCGVLMADGWDVTIRGNTIIGSGGSADHTSAAILLTKYRRMRIVGNTISGCSGHGVWLYDPTGQIRADLERLTITGNDFSDIAMDPVRVAPTDANPGTVTVAGNTFEACAYMAGARLVRISRTTDQRVTVTGNTGDASTYAIDRTTCYNVLANDNTPIVTSTFDPTPRAETGEYIDVTGSGIWIERSDSGYVEISVSMDDIGTGQQLLVDLPFSAPTGTIPNISVNELTEGLAFRAALASPTVLKITTIDNRDVAKTGRFLTIAGEIRKVAA